MRRIVLKGWIYTAVFWMGLFLIPIGSYLFVRLVLDWSETIGNILVFVTFVFWWWFFDSKFTQKGNSYHHQHSSYKDVSSERLIDVSEWDDEKEEAVATSVFDSYLGERHKPDSGLRGNPGSPYTGTENIEYTETDNQYDHELFLEQTEDDF